MGDLMSKMSLGKWIALAVVLAVVAFVLLTQFTSFQVPKSLTQGKPMIMGRKTFDSLPGLLPGRRHIVLTRDTEWEAEGAVVVHDMEDALKIANAPHIAIIGGAEIYQLFLPQADRIALTEVHMDVDGDTVMDGFDPAVWHESKREGHDAENGRPAFSFVTLKRKQA